MSAGMGLEGKMIPRRVKRLFDQRDEQRDPADGVMASLGWRHRAFAVRLSNLSPSGAMVIFDEMPHIGEEVTLGLPDRPVIEGKVQWVREGFVGIHFAAGLE